MKADVVVLFYRKHFEWPYVLDGLAANADHINRVIVTVDEMQDEILRHAMRMSLDDKGLRYALLHQAHDGFGASRCYNKALELVGTEYFLHIGGDCVLKPHAVERALDLAEPGMLIGGYLDDLPPADAIDPDIPLEEQVTRVDPRKSTYEVPYPGYDIRDGHLLIHADTSREIGGYDERYKTYGFVDWDHGLRYKLHVDDDEAFVMGTGEAYHIGGVDTPEAKEHKIPAPASFELYNDLLKRYAEHFGLEVHRVRS